MCKKKLVINVHPDGRVVGSLMFAKMSNKVLTDRVPLVFVVFDPFCQPPDVDEDGVAEPVLSLSYKLRSSP